MIFGLPEKCGEDVSGSVSGLFLATEEKQSVEAYRIGKQRTQDASRPVRVTLAISAIVIQILIKHGI